MSKLIPKYQTGTTKNKVRPISDRIGDWLHNQGYHEVAKGWNDFNNSMGHVFSDLQNLGLPTNLIESGAAVMGTPVGSIKVINKTVPKGVQSELVRLADGTYKRKVGNVLYNPKPYKPLKTKGSTGYISQVQNGSKRLSDKIINGERIDVDTKFFPDTDVLPYEGVQFTGGSYNGEYNWNWRNELEKKLGHPFIY